MDRQNAISELSEQVLDSVSGGQDGGAPPQQTTTTKTESSSTTATGQASAGKKGIVGGGASVTYQTSKEVTTEIFQPCPAPAPAWKGVPWR
jgi:hypothetical protein